MTEVLRVPKLWRDSDPSSLPRAEELISSLGVVAEYAAVMEADTQEQFVITLIKSRGEVPAEQVEVPVEQDTVTYPWRKTACSSVRSN